MKVTVEVPEPVVTPPPTVTLELSLEEAAVVKAALGTFTSGAGTFSMLCSDAWNALERAGVDQHDRVYFFYELKGEVNSNEDSPLPEIKFSGSR